MSVVKIDFEPTKKSIRDIFESSISMSIPRYQRTYAWGRDKVEEFYDDFLVESKKPEDNLAYLGTILFSKDGDGNLEVIDGQQRLVTITIFIAAMRDLITNEILSEQTTKYALALQNFLRKEPVFGSSPQNDSENSIVKLRVGSDIEKLFEELIYNDKSNRSEIKSKNSAGRNVLKAYDLFYSKMKKRVSHPKLTDSARLQLVEHRVQGVLDIEYIDIRVADKEVAFNLFESHNAKGIALKKTDLIKNYFFGRLGGSEANKNKKMDGWDSLLADLTKEGRILPDRFFNYMIQSYEGHFTSSVLYRRIKPYIENPDKFYPMLQINVNDMVVLKTAMTGNKSVDMSLRGIKKMRVSQCFIFLLSLERNKSYLNPKHYQQIVENVESFSYVYSAISKQPTNTLEKLYSLYASDLQNSVDNLKAKNAGKDKIAKERLGGRLSNKLKKEFINLLPPFPVFFENFSNLTYPTESHRTMIRYTFEKIEQYHSKGMIALGDLFTLDHIVPQSKATGKAIYHSIGNLVPLSSEDNSMKGDSPPVDKLGVYLKNSSFYSVEGLVKTLEKEKKFTKNDIHKRTEALAEYAYNEVFSL